MNHDCYYSVDTNMIIAYTKNQIPGWRAYVDHLNSKGKRFFVTDIAHREMMGEKLPPPFHLFNDTEGPIRAKRAIPTIMSAFGVPQSQALKFSNDLEWLLQSGFSLSRCADIPSDELLRGNALAITANATLVRRFLYDEVKRSIFERVVNQGALDHLADVRSVKASDGTYVDRSAF